MAWEHGPVIEKTISLSLLDSHGEISTSACEFDNEEVLVTVDINLRETVVIESRQWWKLQAVVKIDASPTRFLNTYLRLSCSSFSFLWNLVKKLFPVIWDWRKYLELIFPDKTNELWNVYIHWSWIFLYETLNKTI